MVSQPYAPGQLLWYTSPLHDMLETVSRRDVSRSDILDNHLVMVLSNGYLQGNATVCMTTSKLNYPGYILTVPTLSGKVRQCVICPYKIMTVTMDNLHEPMGFVPPNLLAQVQRAVMFHLNMTDTVPEYVSRNSILTQNMQIDISHTLQEAHVPKARIITNDMAPKLTIGASSEVVDDIGVDTDEELMTSTPEPSRKEEEAPSEPKVQKTVRPKPATDKPKTNSASPNKSNTTEAKSPKFDNLFKSLEKGDLAYFVYSADSVTAKAKRYNTSPFLAEKVINKATDMLAKEHEELVSGMKRKVFNIRRIPERLAYLLPFLTLTELSEIGVSVKNYTEACRLYGFYVNAPVK